MSDYLVWCDGQFTRHKTKEEAEDHAQKLRDKGHENISVQTEEEWLKDDIL